MRSNIKKQISKVKNTNQKFKILNSKSEVLNVFETLGFEICLGLRD